MVNAVWPWLFLGGLALFATRCVTPSPIPLTSDPSCLGSMSAETFVVFLHGMEDSRYPTSDQSTRKMLTRIGTDLNIRFAMPKSQLACPTEPGWRCWGWGFDRKELQASTQRILAAVNTCFPKDASFGLIGFSNGGYLLSKLYRTCELNTQLPGTAFSIAIASSQFKDLPRDVAADLRNCGRMSILSESKIPDLGYARLLQSRGGDVEEIRYDGGHIIPEDELRRLLMKAVGNK